MGEFDYVVVGAGSSGCVLAARLTQDPAVRVLLLEAGKRERDPLLSIPIAFPIVMGKAQYNWNYEGEEEPVADNRRIRQPRGKALGGSSMINGMLYARGHPRDYDEWRQLGLEGEDLDGVYNAVDYIAELRQSANLEALAVGRKVVVIGGGNTAIDIAVQTKRLGAEDVTLVYRRGPEAMSATHHEQEFAQVNGVKIKHWAQPREIRGMNGHITDVIFEYTQLDGSGRLAGTGDVFSLPVDMLFKAIGQTMLPQANGGSELLQMDGDKIAVNDQRQTSLTDVWAGGDCVAISEDLTVAAVQDGKLAAEAINGFLTGGA